MFGKKNNDELEKRIDELEGYFAYPYSHPVPEEFRRVLGRYITEEVNRRLELLAHTIGLKWNSSGFWEEECKKKCEGKDKC